MKLISAIILFGASVLNATTADQIVAIVGQRVITRGELEQQIFLYTTQYEIEDEAELTRELLNQMIEGAVLLEEAKKETVSVEHREVEEELSLTMERMKSSFPSEEEFQRRLEDEHLTVAKLRDVYREGIREQLLTRKLIDKKIRPRIKVSPLEVQKFYEQYKDSIRGEPAKVRLAHILLSIVPSQTEVEKAEKKIEEILRKLQEGMSFSVAAKAYSEDPSREQGGDLGYFSRGELLPELEKECFALEPGQISVLSSELGYHVILCGDKTEDSVRVSQIVVGITPTGEDSAQVRTVAEELRRRIADGEDFSELAKLYTHDEKTREAGGDLGYVPVEDLSPPFSDVATTLRAGETSDVVLSPFGYHVIQLVERVEEQKPTLPEIKGQLGDYLVQRKLEDAYREWIEELKQKVYIDVRL
jgi:peptidyl-prolyl cis-trans isomerase SurA